MDVSYRFPLHCICAHGKHISKDTQEIPQSRSTAFLRYQTKERWLTNKNKTKQTMKPPTYEQRRTATDGLGNVSRKKNLERAEVASRKTSLLIAMQLQTYYKHIFGPSTPSVKYHSQTLIITIAMLKQSSIVSWSQNARQPQTGPRWALPQTEESCVI